MKLSSGASPQPVTLSNIAHSAGGSSHSSAVEKIADHFTRDIVDPKGRIRLERVREYFKWRHLREKRGRGVIAECYEKWVECDEYLWFGVWNRVTDEKIGEFCLKCAKRGNDVYRWRLKKRLEWIDELEPEEFFNCRDRNVRGEKTRMLFVNLTYDTSRCSRREAWENIGVEWNRWISAVRRWYGSVKYFRCFEAHENGYPHVHAILLFSMCEFELSYRDKKNKFRILRKDRDWLADKWHSFVDVQACYSTSAFDYVKKYMLKIHGEEGSEVEDVARVNREKATLTLSLLWLFRKQSFSVSSGLRELILDLIGEKHNSNFFPIQITLEGEPLYEFELLGVVTLTELEFKRKPPPNASEKWSFDLPLTTPG